MLLCTLSHHVHAERSHISVALEALPPLINDDGKGMVIDLLREIESISNYTFDVNIMTYARAKRELQGERAQLVGLTPKNNETDEFYQFAKQLHWDVPVSVDLFVTNRDKIKDLKNIYIGVPTGNADFFSELLDIPRKNFVEVTHLTQLTKMLMLDRIDGIIFERISIVETFKETGFKDEVYYHQVVTTAASLAVNNSLIGEILKNEIDHYISQIDSNSIFAKYNQYINLPTSGKLDTLIDATSD